MGDDMTSLRLSRTSAVYADAVRAFWNPRKHPRDPHTGEWIATGGLAATQFEDKLVVGRTAKGKEVLGRYSHYTSSVRPRGGVPGAGHVPQPGEVWPGAVKVTHIRPTDIPAVSPPSSSVRFNPYHAPPGAGGGQFTTAQGAGQGGAKKDGGRARRKAHLLNLAHRDRAKARQLEGELRKLEQQLRASAAATRKAMAANTKATRAAKAAAHHRRAAYNTKTGKARRAAHHHAAARHHRTASYHYSSHGHALAAKIHSLRAQIHTLLAQAHTYEHQARAL